MTIKINPLTNNCKYNNCKNNNYNLRTQIITNSIIDLEIGNFMIKTISKLHNYNFFIKPQKIYPNK
jgi:hypothetical protein